MRGEKGRNKRTEGAEGEERRPRDEAQSLETDLPRRQFRASEAQKRGNAFYFFPLGVPLRLEFHSTLASRWGQMFPPSACHSFTRAYSTRCLARAAREKLPKLATTRFFPPSWRKIFEWRVKSAKDDCSRKVCVSLCSLTPRRENFRPDFCDVTIFQTRILCPTRSSFLFFLFFFKLFMHSDIILIRISQLYDHVIESLINSKV